MALFTIYSRVKTAINSTVPIISFWVKWDRKYKIISMEAIGTVRPPGILNSPGFVF
jgi:hypothetical protein